MHLDLREYNGGSREGAGRPKTVHGYRQVAVRLPEDMARWLLRRSVRICGGSEAELLRRLVREAMEKDTQATASSKISMDDGKGGPTNNIKAD